MDYRRLGRTNFQVSCIGLGGATFAGRFYGKVNPPGIIELIHYALGKGVNYIDTARGYLGSENIIGEALAQWKGKCHVATKIQAGATAEQAIEQFEVSRGNLGRDVIDILMVHDLQTQGDGTAAVDRIMAKDGIVEGFLELKKRGLIRHLGVSGRVTEVLEAIKTGYFDVLLTFNRFNLLDQEALDELIPYAHEKDIGMVIGGVFYQGFLSSPLKTALEGLDKYWDWDMTEEQLAMIRRKLPLLQELAKHDTRKLRELALRFVISEERISTAVVGMMTVDEAKENLNQIQAGPLEEKVLKQIMNF